MTGTTHTEPAPREPAEPAVLIVGAGPTGLTLACVLARAGVPFRLVEAAPGPRPGSRGKGVQPRTLEVFDDLGVADRVIAHGRSGMPIRSTAADGRVTCSGGGAAPARPDVPYPASLITPQWRVEEALRLRLAELGGTVEFGTELRGFEQSDDAVTAVVARGGEAEAVTARHLVGCDGGHSTVRKQSGVAFDGETREDVRMVVADVRADGLDRDAWHMWRHDDGLVALCPLPSTDTFQYQAALAPGEDADLGLDAMQAVLERRTGRTGIRLRGAAWSSLWRANVRLADRYRQGRVYLAGDAAHIHAPAGGQGMNTGIQDAYNLGWKLAAVGQGAPPALLDSYDAERRPVAAGVLALSDARLAEAVERKGIPVRRDAGTTQLGIGYRDSALSRDDRGGGSGGDRTGGDGGRGGAAAALLRAGDRAPDATGLTTVDGERRLFDLTRGPHATLLAFGPAPAVGAARPGLKVFRVVGEPAGPGEVADTGGHLADAYGPTDRTLVLIRPDGHVALISDAGDASALSDHLAVLGRPATD